MFRVGDRTASERFNRTVVGAIGIEPSHESEALVEWDDVRPQYGPEYYGGFLLDRDGNSVEAVHHDDPRRGGHIDHLWIRVRDLDAAAAFYSVIARHTGLRPGETWDRGRQFRAGWSTFSLIADGRPLTENLHVAFPAPDEQTVREFHAAAVAAGYQSNGEPGERPEYHPATTRRS